MLAGWGGGVKDRMLVLHVCVITDRFSIVVPHS